MNPSTYRSKLIAFVILLIFAATLVSAPALLSATPGNSGHLSETAFLDSFNSAQYSNTGRQNGIYQPGPSRLIMQIIENQFYMWREYENPAENSLFIYLLEPSEKALTEAETALLLQSSREWERQSLGYRATSKEDAPEPDHYMLSGTDLELHQYNIDLQRNNTLQNEEMTDNRTPVDESQALIYPYNTVGFLTIDFPSELMRGTAFLISPYTALTNAHNIYAPNFGGWFEAIGFSPAQYETEDKNVIKPFATQSPFKAETNEHFIKYENDNDREMALNYDYAAIFFEEPISGITTFMPLQFNHFPAQISLLGYPGVVHNTFTLGMWHSEGPVINSDEYLLYYTAYTSGGSSGSPVFEYSEQADTYRVVSIHSFTSGSIFSGGLHLNNQNREIIEQWLRWTPDFLTNPVTSLSLNKTSMTMEPGSKEGLIATVIPEDASNSELKWSSSNTAVADVDANGIVSAIGAGSAVITVKTIDGSKEAACSVTVEGTPEAEMIGDLNGDGKIDVLDVVLLMQIILQLTELDEEALARADVNKDGKINVVDVTLILQFSIGMIDTF